MDWGAGTGQGAPGTKSPPRGPGGWDLGSIPGDLGKMLSALAHPVRTGKQIAETVRPIAHARFERGAIELPTHVAGGRWEYPKGPSESEKVRGWAKIGGGLRELAKGPGALLPLVSTGAQISTPEGRRELRTHPAVGLVDVAALAAPTLKGTPLAPLATPVRSGVRVAGRQVARRLPGPLVVRASEIAAPVVSRLPSRAGVRTTTQLSAATRIAGREVEQATGPYAELLAPLNRTQRETLKTHLFRGDPPEPDSPIRPAFDAYRTRQEQVAAAAPARTIPPEGLSAIVDQVAARRGDALVRTVGPEAARQMLVAFKAGLDNPLPALAKPWRDLHRAYDQAVGRENAKWRLAEVPTPGAGGPELFASATARRLARVRTRYGDASPEYRAALEKATPARWRPAVEPLEVAKTTLRERRRNEPRFGQAAYRKLLAEIEADLGYRSWLDLAEAGVDPPVFVHRRALLPGEEATVRAGGKVTGRAPDVLRPVGRLAAQYADDPVAMLYDQERQLVEQTVFAKTVGRIRATSGSRSYTDVLDGYAEMGLDEGQAHRMVRANWRNLDLAGNVETPKPGQVLVPRAVAEAAEAYLRPIRQGTGVFDKLMGAWMVPVLWLSPAFHVNNILSGAVLTGMNVSSPQAVLRHLRGAVRMTREGTLPAEIPVGAGMVPAVRRLVDPGQAEAQGRGLALVLRRAGGGWQKVIDFSRHANETADSMYRSLVYLDRLDRGIRKGVTREAAEAAAVDAASNVMQNWNALSPIERQVFQRLFPFWGWKRTQIRYLLRYPIDHPARMAFFRWAVSPYLDEAEEQGLPERFEHLLPIGGKRDGRQLFVSTRGLDPFADTGSLLAWRGFLSALNPGLQTLLEAGGSDPGLGGVPVGWGDVTVDRDTGQLVRRPSAERLVDVVPQLTALMQAGGLVKGVKPPADQTTAGWVRWSRRYWSKLRLPFPPSEVDVDEARQKFQANLAYAEADRRRRAEQEATAPSSGGMSW